MGMAPLKQERGDLSSDSGRRQNALTTTAVSSKFAWAFGVSGIRFQQQVPLFDHAGHRWYSCMQRLIAMRNKDEVNPGVHDPGMRACHRRDHIDRCWMAPGAHCVLDLRGQFAP